MLRQGKAFVDMCSYRGSRGKFKAITLNDGEQTRETVLRPSADEKKFFFCLLNRFWH
jgi:hypothetical protein